MGASSGRSGVGVVKRYRSQGILASFYLHGIQEVGVVDDIMGELW
jgi:rRNA processing protein Gar1